MRALFLILFCLMLSGCGALGESVQDEYMRAILDGMQSSSPQRDQQHRINCMRSTRDYQSSLVTTQDEAICRNSMNFDRIKHNFRRESR